VPKTTTIEVIEKTIQLIKTYGNKATKKLFNNIEAELNDKYKSNANIVINSVVKHFEINKTSLLSQDNVKHKTTKTIEAIAVCAILLRTYVNSDINSISKTLNLEGESNKSYLHRLMKKYSKEQLNIFSKTVPAYADILKRMQNAEYQILKSL